MIQYKTETASTSLNENKHYSSK